MLRLIAGGIVHINQVIPLLPPPPPMLLISIVMLYIRPHTCD